MTADFLEHERGADIDGAETADVVRERIISIEDAAEDLLTGIPHPKQDKFYVPLSAYNANRFDEVAETLADYFILVPSALVNPQAPSAFYPAVISERGMADRSHIKGQDANVLRLQVLQHPFRREQIAYGGAVLLAAAGQSETEGVGKHGHDGGDGVEAEHFQTLMAVGSDPSIQAAWAKGDHINHSWAGQPHTSVASQVSRRLHGKDAPQETITITRLQVENREAQLLWHEEMRDDDGKPLNASRKNALVIAQAMSFEAIAEQPARLDNLKRMIAQ